MQTPSTNAQAPPQRDVYRHEHPETSAPPARSMVVSSCCAPVKQQTCCAPSDKDACCGTEPADTGGCGCQ